MRLVTPTGFAKFHFHFRTNSALKQHYNSIFIYTPQKKFRNMYAIFFVFKILRGCKFAKLKCMKQYKIVYIGNSTWKKIHKFLNSLDNYFENSKNSHFSQKISKYLENLLCSLLKPFSGDYSSKKDKTCTILHFLVQQLRDLSQGR